jgi:citrate synthase
VAGGPESLDFVQTALLVSTGEVPSVNEKESFESLMRESIENANRDRVLKLAELMRDQHPMDFLHAAALTVEGVGSEGTEDQYRSSLAKYVALTPLMHADFMRTKLNLEPGEWDTDVNYSERFYKARFGEINQDMADVLDLLLVLHADHEQNCSATTARTVASSKAGVRHVVGAAIGALSGPLHGGANEEVVRQLEEMLSSGHGPEVLMRQVIAGERRLMGFGHRVYKNFDPRAVIIKSAAERVAAHVSGGDALLKLAMELEKIALEQDYFISRKLYPNVDFYSGLIYRGIGFDVSEYTSLFAVGRMPGWISQSAEQAGDKEQRIVRPQQIYTGNDRRELRRAH